MGEALTDVLRLQMRRILSYLLLLLSFAFSSLLHAYTVELDGLCYNFIGPYAYVTSRGMTAEEQSGYVGDLVVPEQIEYNGKKYEVIYVDNNAFANCEALTSVSLPSSVRQIGACTFLGCTALRQVSLPASLMLSSCTFTGCTSLQGITMPRQSKLIDTLTYYCCASLTSIVLPHRIRTVCQGGLEHLPSLRNLYCFSSVPPVAESGAFTPSDQKRCTLHVPKDVLQKYKQSPGWGDFYRIVPLEDADYLQMNYKRGDVNDDGRVDAEDLSLVRQVIVGKPDPDAVNWAADINEDGIVNAVDYVTLAKRL